MNEYTIFLLKDEYVDFFESYHLGLYHFFDMLRFNNEYSALQSSEMFEEINKTMETTSQYLAGRNDVVKDENSYIIINNIANQKITFEFNHYSIKVKTDKINSLILDILLQNSKNYVIIDTENQSVDWLYKNKVR